MYFVALDGVSRYALSEAVKAIIRGKLGHTFFPTPVEFRQQCDAAMEPHYREQRRAQQRHRQSIEDREFNLVTSQRTSEAKARVASIYADFCKSYEKQSAEETFKLDPELVAQIPDNPKSLARQRMGK